MIKTEIEFKEKLVHKNWTEFNFAFFWNLEIMGRFSTCFLELNLTSILVPASFHS